MRALNRVILQELARTRLDDACVLLENQRYAGAYYVAGYVIECALKACIAKQTQQHDFPPDRKRIEKVYIHDLGELVKTAGLRPELDEDTELDDIFSDYWNMVKDWNESSRYRSIEPREAEDLIKAVSDPEHGVFQWLQEHW